MEIINKFDEEEVSSFLSPMQSPGWQRKVDLVLTPFNLTQPSFSILTIVGWQAKQNIASVSSSHVRQKVVVDMSGMPKMQVSLILQHLKKSKLINISPYPLDLREQQVELTRDGKEACQDHLFG